MCDLRGNFNGSVNLGCGELLMKICEIKLSVYGGWFFTVDEFTSWIDYKTVEAAEYALERYLTRSA